MPSDKGAPASGATSRGPESYGTTTRSVNRHQDAAQALRRLSTHNRARVAARLDELRDLDTLMRQPGALTTPHPTAGG